MEINIQAEYLQGLSCPLIWRSQASPRPRTAQQAREHNPGTKKRRALKVCDAKASVGRPGHPSQLQAWPSNAHTTIQCPYYHPWPANFAFQQREAASPNLARCKVAHTNRGCTSMVAATPHAHTSSECPAQCQLPV